MHVQRKFQAPTSRILDSIVLQYLSEGKLVLYKNFIKPNILQYSIFNDNFQQTSQKPMLLHWAILGPAVQQWLVKYSGQAIRCFSLCGAKSPKTISTSSLGPFNAKDSTQILIHARQIFYTFHFGIKNHLLNKVISQLGFGKQVEDFQVEI